MAQTARQRFRTDKTRVQRHADFVDSSAVQESLDIAMRELIRQYNQERGPSTAMNAYRLQGAEDLIMIWNTLADTETAKVQKTKDSLYDPDNPPIKTSKPE